MRRDWSGDVMVELARPVYSDIPIWNPGAQRSSAAEGTRPGKSNPQGAISVTADDGSLLGVRPGELTRWWYVNAPECPFVWVRCAWMPERVAGGDDA